MADVKLAKSLQRAEKGDLIHFDAKGRVRSPARYHAIRIGFFLFLGGIAVIEAALCFFVYVLMPSVGIAMAIFMMVAFTWIAYVVSRALVLKEAQSLVALDRIDEAAALCERVERAPLIGPIHRARARQSLSGCRAVQGRYDEALALVQRALSSGLWRRKKPFGQLGRYHEIFCLVNVG